MKTSQLLGGGVRAASLLFSVSDASGKLAPPRFVPPPQEIAPTTQAHLETAKRELDQVLQGLRQLQKQDATLYGGFLEHTVAEVLKAQANVGQAFIHLWEHPVINSLAVGPIPKEAEQPAVVGLKIPDNPMWLKLDLGLYQASAALRNGRAGAADGPVLDEIGGCRAKIIEDVSRARKSLAECRRSAGSYRFSGRWERDLGQRRRTVLAGVALSVGLAVGGL